jgi:hypothetical protein
MAVEYVAVEYALDGRSESIKALAQIHGLDRHEDLNGR